jgi:hypothetical protein
MYARRANAWKLPIRLQQILLVGFTALVCAQWPHAADTVPVDSSGTNFSVIEICPSHECIKIVAWSMAAERCDRMPARAQCSDTKAMKRD